MLEERVRELTEEPINPFNKKRLRRELLERVSGPRRSVRRPAYVAALACFGALAVALAIFFIGRASAPPSGVVVVATSGSFSEEVNGDVRRVVLTDGDFEFDVKHVPGTPRLLVVVPDGEIEDIGTRFLVSVRDGKTVSVHVSEGEVEFRRLGEAPLRLIAGMTFRPRNAESSPPSIAPAAPATTGSGSPPLASPSAPIALAPPAIANAPRAPRAAPKDQPNVAKPLASTQPVASAKPSASERPPAEVSVAEEDTLYLAILRAEDRGDLTAARSLASKYLATYPDGFRRREVQSVHERVKNHAATGQP